MANDFLKRVQQRMAARSRQPRTRPKTRLNIDHHRIDDLVWSGVRRIETIDQTIIELTLDDLKGTRKGYDNAPELVQDTFLGLYKAAPEYVPEDQVQIDARLNRRILDEIMASPYWPDLRAKTATDEILAAMALGTINEGLKEILEREVTLIEMANALARDEGGCGGVPGGDPSDESGEGEGEPGGQARPGGDEGEEEGNSAGRTEAEQAFDEAVQEADLELIVNEAVKAADDQLSGLDEARTGIGLETGEWRTLSPEERLKIAEKLSSPQMRELAQWVGRMRRLALALQATKVTAAPDEIWDVTTGDDVSAMLHSELALLGDDTELEFYRRFIEKDALVYAKRGIEVVARGPIITCIDKSGSMDGTPMHWAMGAAEALRRICQEQNRDYTTFFFGNDNDRHRFDFPDGKGPAGKILEFLSVEANGGTQFQGVLDEALDRVRTDHELGRDKADIVFITDGAAHLTDEWVHHFNTDRKEAGCRVYGIYIGGAYDMARKPSGVSTLERFCDVVISVHELRADSASKVFSEV